MFKELPENKQPHGQGGAGVVGIDDKYENTLARRDSQANSWIPLNDALDRVMQGLCPEQAAEQEQFNVVFVLLNMLRPHQEEMKKFFIITLHSYGVLTLAQAQALFNKFRLQGA